MRKSAKWGLTLLLVFGGVAVYVGRFLPMSQTVEWLAGQPDVLQVVDDPTRDPADALLTVLTFAVAAPAVIAAGLAATAAVVKRGAGFLMPIVLTLRLPAWVAIVLAGGAGAVVVLATREIWFPRLMNVLGLVARAYLVWTASRVPS